MPRYHSYYPKTKNGNAMRSPFFQPKLAINQPNDVYEQEADAVADKVMRMNEPPSGEKFFSSRVVQRKCAACEEEEKEKEVQRKESSDHTAEASAGIENYLSSLSGGKELSKQEKQFFESGIGSDFSNVRLHTDGAANESAKIVNALAYTHGDDIVFAADQYQPDTHKGKKLLAHELVHTIQQNENSKQATLNIQAQTDVTAPADAAQILRDRVLAPFLRNDAMAFLSALRGLSAADATTLAADDIFFERIRHVFHGKALFSVFTILYFNNRMRDPFLRLHLALHRADARLITDTLNLVVNDPLYTTLFRRRFREAVNNEIAGNRLLPAINSLIDNPGAPGVSTEVNKAYREVHYEQTGPGGAWQLTTFGETIRATLYNTGSELRVIVKLRFVDGTNPMSPYYFLGDHDGPLLETWLAAIDQLWNGKFLLNNGRNALRLVFVPMVLNTDPTAHEIRILTDHSVSCATGMARGSSGCWYTDWNGTTVAHEFGHLIGASDEYNLPSTAAEIPAAIQGSMSAEDISLTTYEGITGQHHAAQPGGETISDNLMSDRSAHVYSRHVQRLVNAFNNQLPAGTPRYAVREMR